MTQYEKLNQLQEEAQLLSRESKDILIRKFLINAIVGFEIKKAKITIEQTEMLV